ncbi:tetratricopeptide repeat protein [Oligoflexaceae bacterium]|nr:tetratricopeptide repeat protein [Oligoflexaceae bacterium]
MKILLVTALVAGLFSCRTTDNKIARVDKHKRFVEVQSNSSDKSAMIRPKEVSKYSQTTKDLKEKNVKNQDKKSLLNLAKLYLMQEKFDDAENTSRKVLRMDIKNTEAKKVLAQVAIRRNNPEMASILLNSLGAEKSKDSQLLNMLGLVALKENNRAAAMDYFRRALKANPSDVAVRMNMGVLFVDYRQLSSAAIQFERVLQVMPEHADAKLHLAIIKASNGKNSEALAVYEDVLAQDSKNPLALYNMAVIQRKDGEFEDSLDNLKQYLKTKHARKTDNTTVFALIDRVQNEQSQVSGESASDLEIQALAAKLKDGPVEKGPQVATVGPGTEEAAPIEDQAGTSSDEILELERQLVD